MKIFILLISTVLIQACSSNPKMQVHKTKGIDPELEPFVYEFKVNHPAGEAANTEIPVNFSNKILSHGVCYLRMDVADREILVNIDSWKSFPDKREYIMNYLLSSCYETNALQSPLYEIHVRGF